VHWDRKGLNPITNQSINNPEGYFASWCLCDNEYRHYTVVTQNTIGVHWNFYYILFIKNTHMCICWLT